MERSKRDLEALVTTQKEQLTRYEKRLKDVVTAYKGLLKEKEALETSLSAITANTSNKSDEKTNSFSSEVKTTADNLLNATVRTNDGENISTPDNGEDKNQLQTQIITLMNSLATLSAEKSRMEASFQADKKQLRAQMAQKDQIINELQMKIKDIEERSKIAVDEVKAKWIIERQEREKETNNQMLMIRELQKLYADERHLKENIEMQLNNFKIQFASDEAENQRINELQSQLKEARNQMKNYQTRKSNDNSEDISSDSAILMQVQQEMQQLKEQHAIAIKVEQKRVHIAEERSKKLAAMHEDRVANLEARLAELSSTVGTYDRLRHQDQKSIQDLKQKLQNIDANRHNVEQEKTNYPEIGDKSDTYRKLSKADYDISRIVDEVMHLKKLLIAENARSTNPIDVNKVFSINTDHERCLQDINRANQECDAVKEEFSKLKEKSEVQKAHISTLQEKVIVLNRNIDEQELELKQQHEKKQQAIKDERSKWKEIVSELENEYRSKVYDMEQQLQKQRQRSLQLLEEKEQEIKTLQTSFEVFHTAAIPTAVTVSAAEQYNGSSDGESVENDNNGKVMSSNKVHLKSKKLSVGENCHMLHYANEIARKDIEITGLRKAKYAAETSLRKAIHDKISVQEGLCDKIAELEEQVDRLERCKTREGANLEYLKNVIISFIMTKDADGKQHMLNAISAVLQFTHSEIQSINNVFSKK